MTEGTVTVVNDLGLHLRAAARFVELASRFRSSVRVHTQGPSVDGKSLLALSSLLARRGTTLHVACEGVDEAEACAALCALVASGFEGGGAP